METHIWHLPVPIGCVWGGFNKETMVPASSVISQRAASLPLSLRSNNSVPPCIFLASFELISLLWSLGRMSQSVFRSFKSMLGSAAVLCLTWTKSLLIFTASCCGQSSSQQWQLLSNLPKVSQLVSSRVGFKARQFGSRVHAVNSTTTVYSLPCVLKIHSLKEHKLAKVRFH